MNIKELKQIVDKLKRETNFYSLNRIQMVHLITHLFEKIEELQEKYTTDLPKKRVTKCKL
jgi:hypothetical protein